MALPHTNKSNTSNAFHVTLKGTCLSLQNSTMGFLNHQSCVSSVAKTINRVSFNLTGQKIKGRNARGFSTHVGFPSLSVERGLVICLVTLVKDESRKTTGILQVKRAQAKEWWYTTTCVTFEHT